MPVYRVEFNYLRRVVTHLAADSPDDIHEFLEDNPTWDILEDAPEIVDHDDTVVVDDDWDGDYAVTPCTGRTANYGIHEGLIIEVES